MSAIASALVISKKQKKSQSIGRFLSKPKPGLIVDERRVVKRIICPYEGCPETFESQQGYSSHKKKHEANNDRIGRTKTKYGPVKIRYDLLTEEQRAELERERAGAAAAAATNSDVVDRSG